MYYADVILPLYLPKAYTYAVPQELQGQLMPGQRVVVQFGKSKLYTAIIKTVHNNAPTGYTPKELQGLIDERPIINAEQLKFWNWISHYYLCTEGEVMSAALPAGLKLQSETKIIFNPDEAETAEGLNEKEYAVLDMLHIHQVMGIDELGKVTGIKNIHGVIKNLLERNIVSVYEELKEKFKPKKDILIKLADAYDDEEELKQLFDKIEKRSPAQLEVILAYITLSHRYSDAKQPHIRKAEFMRKLPEAWPKVKALEKKGVLEILEVEADFTSAGVENYTGKNLTDWQQEALVSVKKQLEEKDVVLLQGVTSSGKTEVYIKLIAESIGSGKQVLFLMPEIALTTQIINRLKKVFGTKVGVYHSRLNENERIEVWNHTLSYNGTEGSGYEILLGARSALFMPFTKLGLVIVDEEHENSFKQYDPAPRYHARDAAIYLASLFKAKTVLGSATPALETYYNANNGKYGYVIMHRRYADMAMPTVEVLNLKELRKRKQMHSIFAKPMLDDIGLALQNKEQVILFQNRRGYAPFIECSNCAWVPQCINCDVSLTYHKQSGVFKCHYCGYHTPPPTACAACGSTALQLKGFGTEKVEDELKIFFPEARIARMDLETTRSKNSYRLIIEDFENGQIDILVGTQMVTKGLDFDNVSLVGILNADTMLNFPDFRAFERSYQLMVQVSGRAGRKNKTGKVMIQTTNPDHVVIKSIIAADMDGFYSGELEQRQNFHYPPYFKLVEFSIKHKNPDLVNLAAAQFGTSLKNIFGNRVLGPEFALIPRINNYYIKKIMLKVERDAPSSKVRDVIEECIHTFLLQPDFKYVQIIADADPA
jgi:primosomal protein N' (replication factor Y)